MARGNKLRGEAHFTIDGVDYLLSINNRTWIEAEEVLDRSILDVVEELRADMAAGRNPRLKVMLAIVFGGLVQNHPDITQDDVLEMTTEPELKDALIRAMAGTEVPAAGDGDVGNARSPVPKAKRAGTGKASSKAGAKRASTRKTSGTRRRAR